ncbi:hypothetical protein BCR36DRAFT_97017 [Piromyces finnis]|uniref:Tubby C-terminal domain-containing protein n=1 Tax=Piromyces finnis TaxID=1754191 RepID=A0A1Y1V616_9FUNG|nr:hypothetical protein BCR36DRAFT_97017 [Piromyces finnis]|eukprot:ORX47374.1 hypothetical protein BCR36DRAFT_97017 [Piromyces finnis]
MIQKISPNNIRVINDKYVYEKKTTFHYKPGNFIFDFRVEDENNKMLYKHKYNGITGNSVLYDPKTDKKLFKFKVISHITKPNEIIITSMKDDKEMEKISCIQTVKPLFIKYKCEIEFFNKATKKNEIIEVRCPSFNKDCTVYYGREKENGILIGQFSSKSFFGSDFKIDIMPGVDTLFILLIIIQVIRSVHARKVAAAS